ncbi:hypothetical protein ACU8KH_01848 [Lachancea thermotolerans]
MVETRVVVVLTEAPGVVVVLGPLGLDSTLPELVRATEDDALERVLLEDVSLEIVIIEGVAFDEAMLDGVVLEIVKLEIVLLDDALLDDVVVEIVVLEAVLLAVVALEGVALEGVALEGVALEGVALEDLSLADVLLADVLLVEVLLECLADGTVSLVELTTTSRKLILVVHFPQTYDVDTMVEEIVVLDKGLVGIVDVLLTDVEIELNELSYWLVTH